MKTYFTLFILIVGTRILTAQSGILYFPDCDGVQALAATSDGNLVFVNEDRMTKCDYTGVVIWQTIALDDLGGGTFIHTSDDRNIYEMPDGDFIFFNWGGMFRISADGDVLLAAPVPGINERVMQANRDAHGFQLIGQNDVGTDHFLVHLALDEDLNIRFSYSYPYTNKIVNAGMSVHDDQVTIGLNGLYNSPLSGRVQENIILDTLGTLIYDTETLRPELDLAQARGINDKLYVLEKLDDVTETQTLKAYNADMTEAWSADMSTFYDKDSLLHIAELSDGNLIMINEWFEFEYDSLTEVITSSQRFEIFSPTGEHISSSSEFVRSSSLWFYPTKMIVLADDVIAIGGSMVVEGTEIIGCIIFVDTAGIVDGIYLNGRVYEDENGNGIYDEGEVFVPYPKIAHPVLPTYIIGDENGMYNFFAATPGEITTEWINTPYWDLCSPEEYTYTLTPAMMGSIVNDQDFRIDYTTPSLDLSVSIVDALSELPVVDCDTINRFVRVTVANVGNVNVAEVELLVTLEDYFDITEISPYGFAIGSEVFINFSDLAPFESRDFTINYTLEFDTALVGTEYTIGASVTPIMTDVYTPNNYAEYSDPYLYAFDPNNKVVQPDGDGPAGYIPVGSIQSLQYTINFQNTGTAEAHNVFLIDTLSEKLDPATLILLNATHDVIMENIAPSVYKWSFYDINLTPHLDDFEHSYGSITFSVGLDPYQEIGDIIENNAAIYFDLNEPVITNTTIITLIQAESVEDATPTLSMQVYPNPARDLLTVQFSEPVTSGSMLTIYAINGKRIQSLEVTDPNSITIPTNKLHPGMYYLQYNNSVAHFIKL